MTSEVGERDLVHGRAPEPDDLRNVNDFLGRVMANMDEFGIRSVAINLASRGLPTAIVIREWGEGEEGVKH